MKLKCDVCGKLKKYSGTNESKIYHFTGFIGNKWYHHWHICKKCVKKNDISLCIDLG